MFSTKLLYQTIAHFCQQGLHREVQKQKKKKNILGVLNNSAGTTATASVENQFDLSNNKELETHKTIQDIPIPSPHVQSQFQIPQTVLSRGRKV